MAEDDMVTVTDAAAELNIGVTSLYRHVKKLGLMTYKRIGDKKSYLRREDMEKLKGFMPRAGEKKAS